MKNVLYLLLLLKFNLCNAQITISMTRSGGVYFVPCKINDLPLKFIFDTGASDVSISLTEAAFMLRNGFLSEKDIIGSTYYQVANGNVEKGTKINLKIVEIGGIKLYNVQASVVHNLTAPLLFGQSAMKKLGKVQIDFDRDVLIINTSPYQNQTSSGNTSEYTRNGYIYSGYIKSDVEEKVPLWSEESILSAHVIIFVPKNAKIFVIEETLDMLKVQVTGKIGYIRKSIFLRL